MGIELRAVDIRVTQMDLHFPHVHPCLQQPGCTVVPQGMGMEVLKEYMEARLKEYDSMAKTAKVPQIHLGHANIQHADLYAPA